MKALVLRDYRNRVKSEPGQPMSQSRFEPSATSRTACMVLSCVNGRILLMSPCLRAGTNMHSKLCACGTPAVSSDQRAVQKPAGSLPLLSGVGPLGLCKFSLKPGVQK
jgi:hypothetical protein